MSQQEGKTTYKRRPSYLPSIISISMVLFMLGLFGLIIITGNKLASHVREKFKLEVFLRDEAPETDLLRLQKEVAQEAYAKEVNYISKAQALKSYTADIGYDFMELAGHNPLPASLELYLKSEYANVEKATSIEKELRKNPLVEDVVFSEDQITLVNRNLSKISAVVLTVGGIFLLIAIALINSTIRLNLYARRFLIKSMQLVGATQWFIIRPFMLRSVIHGVYGTLIASLLLGTLLSALPQKFNEIRDLYDYPAFAVLFGGILISGILISIVSSLLATKRYLRLKLDDLY